MGLKLSHFSPLLIPVIDLVDSLKLMFSRKLGKNNWHVTDFINCTKEVNIVRETCNFIEDKDDWKHLKLYWEFVSLLEVQKHSLKNCVFGQKENITMRKWMFQIFINEILTKKLQKKLQMLQMNKKKQAHFKNSKNTINMGLILKKMSYIKMSTINSRKMSYIKRCQKRRVITNNKLYNN